MILQPRHFEVTEDRVLPVQNARYVTLVVHGTWQVEIDGLMYLPGQTLSEKLEDSSEFTCSYTIRFVRDMTVATAVPASFVPITVEVAADFANNPNLKQGKFVYVRLLTIRN